MATAMTKETVTAFKIALPMGNEFGSKRRCSRLQNSQGLYPVCESLWAMDLPERLFDSPLLTD
jgi:hypothetical protein